MAILHYWLITPDGTAFELASPQWSVDLHVPDGFDLPPITHDAQSVYQQPGAQLSAVKIGPRTVALTLNLNGTSREELHQLRKQLWRSVRWNTTTNDSPPDPLILRYEFNGQLADLYGYFLSDNLANIGEDDKEQTVVLQFIAYDPYWYRVQAASLSWDETDTLKTTALLVQQALTTNYIVGKQNGLWSNLDTGTDDYVLCLARGMDGSIYAGGRFGNVGSPAVAVAGIAKWDGANWSALGAGLGGYAYALAVAPNGDLYAGGSMAGGIVKWNGSSWAVVGAGLDDDVYALAIDDSGNVYAGGKFLNVGGGGIAVSRIAKWDGSAWSALGTGADGNIFSLTANHGAPSGSTILFAGGNFTNIGTATGTNNIAAWNGTTWSKLGAGLEDGSSNTVYALVVGLDGSLYAGGNFNLAGPPALSRIARWNGSAWFALTSGVSSAVYSLAVDNVGMLYVGGDFGVAGGLSIGDCIATWNGTSWGVVDIDLPGSAVVYAVLGIDWQNLFIGYYSLSSTSIASGSVTNLTQNGDAEAFPIITLTGPGLLQWIENVQAQKRITFNLQIQQGETVTIDLTPGVKTFTSSTRGNLMRYSALLPISDFAGFVIPSEPIAPNGQSTLNMMMTAITPAEFNDNNNQLSGWASLTGVSPLNTDDGGKMYASIVSDGGGFYHVNLYDDAARTHLVGHTASYNGAGAKAISADNASGLGGTITVDAVTAADADIYVYFATAKIEYREPFLSADSAVIQ